MIEINLLPGSGKKGKSKGGGGSSIDIGAALKNFAAKVTDPFLLGAVGSGVAAAVIIGGLYTRQITRQSSLEDKERRAVKDSTQYAVIVKSIRKAQAKRDSVVRQLNIIKVIDNNRFVWPHVMDEVSRALPPYTWLTSLQQTNMTAVPQASAAPPKPAKKGENADSAAAATPVQLQIVGNTVDIQALTRFMKALEASPFLQDITLVKTTVIPVEGREVTEFQLTGTYQQPDSALVKRVPIALSVR
ncbi:MAG TPA: PilN domain-containing protein [Gemmatimonadaceae bacterium]|nr:PilN domain-containing protein [Gemmatimonadaceae bacterium]